MAFWRRGSDGPRLDLAAGDTGLAEVLADGPLDLDGVVALLDGRPLGSETRAHAVHAIGLDPRLDDVLPPEPADGSTVALVAAVRRHDLAWAARGRGVTSSTTEDQFGDFHALLADVEGDLLRLTRSRPGDDEPHWHLLSCARGLEREDDVVQARFDALRGINPTHRKGFTHVLRRLAPKWAGTMDRMLGFAWEASEHTAAGSVLHGLVAEAQVEAVSRSSAWAARTSRRQSCSGRTRGSATRCRCPSRRSPWPTTPTPRGGSATSTPSSRPL